MPFNIIRNDISKVKADAIVNTANANVAVGAGVDQAIYEAAGFDELLAERAKIGLMKPGQAAATPAFALDAKYIIHTVGPAWQGANIDAAREADRLGIRAGRAATFVNDDEGIRTNYEAFGTVMRKMASMETLCDSDIEECLAPVHEDFKKRGGRR